MSHCCHQRASGRDIWYDIWPIACSEHVEEGKGEGLSNRINHDNIQLEVAHADGAPMPDLT